MPLAKLRLCSYNVAQLVKPSTQFKLVPGKWFNNKQKLCIAQHSCISVELPGKSSSEGVVAHSHHSQLLIQSLFQYPAQVKS